MNANENFGVIYVVYGSRYLKEALHSRASLARVHPELSAHLVTSQADLDAMGDELRQHFQSISIHPDLRHSFRDKISGLIELPYDRNLFLDSDTEILARVDDLFDILGKFEVAYSRDTVRYAIPAPDVPPVFSEPNSGVLAIRRTAGTNDLVSRWLELHDVCEAEYKKVHGENGVYIDQGTLRMALYESAVPQYVFGEEYNLRVYAKWYAGARVRILHAREPYLSKYRHTINQCEDVRYGDGEGVLGRLWYEAKQLVKRRVFGHVPKWKTKESLNKQYLQPPRQ